MASSGEPEPSRSQLAPVSTLRARPRRHRTGSPTATTPSPQLPDPPPTGGRLAPGLVQRSIQGVRRQLADPLAANGYWLIGNSGVTGALGLAYWLLMAREYPTAAVGRASALYAAMNLLAGITAQNFNGVLTRFIPRPASARGRSSSGAYAVSAAASVCISILFLVTIGWWGASYSELDTPAARAAFVVCGSGLGHLHPPGQRVGRPAQRLLGAGGEWRSSEWPRSSCW